jgi:UDP-glucose 4-epimerase
MKIAILGGAGFIGNNLAIYLKKSGEEVCIIDKQQPPNLDIPFFNTIDSFIENDEFINTDVIFDCIYGTNPKTSFDNPIMDITSNLPGLINRFEFSLKLKTLKKYIFLSSGGTVYGNCHNKLINENESTNPISPYGITKLASEKYGLMYRELKGLPFIIVRPSNTYGPGQKPNMGQGLIITAIDSVFKNKSLLLYGNGKAVRDYIYISDLCNALKCLAKDGIVGETYNIASGIGYSNIEVVLLLKNILEEIGLNLNYSLIKERGFDVNYNTLDISKMLSAFDWAPQITLDQGVVSLLNWYKSKYAVL